MRAGWCRSWQTGGWWIVSCLSPGCGCTTDSSGQSRVINHLQKNGNWGLRRESSVLTSETKLVLLPPHQQLVSPCPAMCPGASQVTLMLQTLQGKLDGLCCSWDLPTVPCLLRSRHSEWLHGCHVSFQCVLLGGRILSALYRGPCELGSRVKARAGPSVPPPQPEVLLGTGVGVVPVHSWFCASCGDVPPIPPFLLQL